jgi:hypothetical protein
LALRLASNFPLAILFLSIIFSLQQFLSLPKASHTKKPKAFPTKKQSLKAKAKASKQKAWGPPSVSLLYPVVNRVEQWFSGRGMTL